MAAASMILVGQLHASSLQRGNQSNLSLRYARFLRDDACFSVEFASAYVIDRVVVPTILSSRDSTSDSQSECYSLSKQNHASSRATDKEATFSGFRKIGMLLYTRTCSKMMKCFYKMQNL